MERRRRKVEGKTEIKERAILERWRDGFEGYILN
jgi:hypothetical protein